MVLSAWEQQAIGGLRLHMHIRLQAAGTPLGTLLCNFKQLLMRNQSINASAQSGVRPPTTRQRRRSHRCSHRRKECGWLPKMGAAREEVGEGRSVLNHDSDVLPHILDSNLQLLPPGHQARAACSMTCSQTDTHAVASRRPKVSTTAGGQRLHSPRIASLLGLGAPSVNLVVR